MGIFINLSSIIINKLHIVAIIKKPNEYFMHINNFHNKSLVIGNLVAYNETIPNSYNIIKICKIKNDKDYKIIEKLIDEI